MRLSRIGKRRPPNNSSSPPNPISPISFVDFLVRFVADVPRQNEILDSLWNNTISSFLDEGEVGNPRSPEVNRSRSDLLYSVVLLNSLRSPRFLFDGDALIAGEVWTILRPMFGGVILILLKQRNVGDNGSWRNKRNLRVCFTVDERRKGTEDTLAAMTHFVNQLDQAENHMKLIFVIGGLNFPNLFVPLQQDEQCLTKRSLLWSYA